MSLEPIAGESLVSYLLRLAHRLSLPPLHLARMAGLASGPRHSHIARKLLLDIAPPQAEAFARLARLTTGKSPR
jgi:TniQ